MDICSAHSVLRQFEPKNGQPAHGKRAWLPSKNKDQDTSRERRRTLLRRLDNSVIRADTDSDIFIYEIYQLRDELSDVR